MAEGCVGAGAGVIAFGWKGGLGASSRRLEACGEVYTLGALVQANFGGQLTLGGAPLWRELAPPPTHAGDGSAMLVVATDAPLRPGSLRRLAARALLALARTGSTMAHGSGDYAIAFSTAASVRRGPDARLRSSSACELPGEALSSLFQAAAEATEEAVVNALFAAVDMTGHRGRACALPVREALSIIERGGGLRPPTPA